MHGLLKINQRRANILRPKNIFFLCPKELSLYRLIKTLKPYFKMLVFLKILLAVFNSLFSLITNVYVHENSEHCTPVKNSILKCASQGLILEQITRDDNLQNKKINNLKNKVQ